MNYTLEELLAVNLAHSFRDCEVGFTGLATGSAAAMYITRIPLAAMELAKNMHAPNLTVLLSGWCHNPDISALIELPESEYDSTFLDLPCEAHMNTWPGQWSHRTGEISFAFGSGVQVDQFGNLNSTCIGPADRPKVALVGPIFLPEHMSIFGREYIMMPHHERRAFVEHVDHITGVGFPNGREGRRQLGLTGNGPAKIYTPKCIFSFDDEGIIYVESIHPGITARDVIDNTDFELGNLSDVPTTPAPTEIELHILRTKADPNGILLGTGVYDMNRGICK